MSFKKLLNGIFLCASFTAGTAMALPTEITFTNNTPLDLATSISGIPGHGVAPNVTRPVSYSSVSIGCYLMGRSDSCPITFTDKATGENVAMVYMNSNTATLTQPPVFFGNYAENYEVTGWESSPITHITISKKA